MARTLVINLDRCSGCESCVTTCKYENGLPLGEYYGRVVPVESGTFPNTEQYWLPVQCQQCENPQCIAVCPTGAAYRDKTTGVVLVDGGKCIGCQYCVYACPWGVRSFSKEHGVAQKCTLCSQLTGDGSDDPVCVHNCPCGARFFGDTDDPESPASQELARYGEDCIHTLSDPKDSKPTCTYILSPGVASWKEVN